jgi:RNA polymerase sigma factor (sigma-70 family)
MRQEPVAGRRAPPCLQPRCRRMGETVAADPESDYPKELADQLQRYSKVLHTYLTRFFKNRDDLKEVVQVTHLRILEYARKGGRIDQLLPLLYRTAEHAAIDELRKRRVRPHDFKSESIDSPGVDVAGGDDPAEAAYAEQELEHVRAQLSEPDRQIFRLDREEGRSAEEIARITGYSLETIKSYITSMRQACRKAWRGE